MVHGIREIHEDQSLSRHYYHIALSGAEAPGAYLVDGLDTRDNLVKQWEPTKNLVALSLAN